MTRRKPALPHDLRVERWSRSMIPGTDAGTVEIASLPEASVGVGIVGGASSSAGGGTFGRPASADHVRVSGSGVTIPAAGADLFTLADTIGRQQGMPSIGTPGDALSTPHDGSYLLEVAVKFTDGHTGGAEVVYVAETRTQETWAARSGSAWVERSAAILSTAGTAITATVTPSDASDHVADITVRATLVQPIGRLLPLTVNTIADVEGDEGDVYA